MPDTSTPVLVPARYSVPDPTTNAAIQDIYNKLNQVSAQLANLSPSQLSPVGAKIGDVLTWNGKAWVPKTP